MSDNTTFTFTLELPAAQAERIATAICVRNGYDATSGSTPVEFTRGVVMRWLVNQTLAYESDIAVTLARAGVMENHDDPLVNIVMPQEQP